MLTEYLSSSLDGKLRLKIEVILRVLYDACHEGKY